MSLWMQHLVFKVAISMDLACECLLLLQGHDGVGSDEQAALELMCQHEKHAKRACEFAIATGVPALVQDLVSPEVLDV